MATGGTANIGIWTRNEKKAKVKLEREVRANNGWTVKVIGNLDRMQLPYWFIRGQNVPQSKSALLGRKLTTACDSAEHMPAGALMRSV